MTTRDCYPIGLRRIDEATICFEWNDGKTQELTAGQLRECCPCATCREKRTAPAQDPLQLPVISHEEAQPLTISAMKPVGNYAYQVTFSDGHDTGIFTFERLRAMDDREE